MEVEVRSHYYNYYNVKGRYTTSEPVSAGWAERYESVEDRIEGNNNNKDSELYKAYVKLEDIYYDIGAANRAKYSSYDELQTAIGQKYLFSNSPYYGKYSYTERRAMYENELSMSAFGYCGNMNDPRLNGAVHGETDSEKKSYNRQCVNNQINNIFTNNGISQTLFGNSSFMFIINPYTYQLTVEGNADKSILSQMETLLNENGNSKELFFHILNSIDDMYLSIGFENGQLKDMSNSNIINTGFNVTFWQVW